MATADEIQKAYDNVVRHLKEAQRGIQSMFGNEPAGPASRAAYEAATSLDVCFLWFGQATAYLSQKSDEAIEKIVDEKLKNGDLKVI